VRDRRRRCRASRTFWSNSSVTVTLEAGTYWIAAGFPKTKLAGRCTIGLFAIADSIPKLRHKLAPLLANEKLTTHIRPGPEPALVGDLDAKNPPG
jgi:hypothetical protein